MNASLCETQPPSIQSTGCKFVLESSRIMSIVSRHQAILSRPLDKSISFLQVEENGGLPYSFGSGCMQP